jgi:hypothetical protein
MDLGSKVTFIDLSGGGRNGLLYLPDQVGFGGFFVKDPAKNRLYHLVYYGQAIQVIGMDDSSVIETIRIPGQSPNRLQGGIVDEARNRIVIINEEWPHRFLTIDRDSLKTKWEGVIKPDSKSFMYCIAAAPSRRSFFVDSLFGAGFWEVDLKTLAVKRTKFVGLFSLGMAVDEDRNLLSTGAVYGRERLCVNSESGQEKADYASQAVSALPVGAGQLGRVFLLQGGHLGEEGLEGNGVENVNLCSP